MASSLLSRSVVDFTINIAGRSIQQGQDHVVVLGEAHLRRVLVTYGNYYNELRTHKSLTKDTPLHRIVERLGTTSRPILAGLHHQYCRI